jgi:hypothetical protein
MPKERNDALQEAQEAREAAAQELAAQAPAAAQQAAQAQQQRPAQGKGEGEPQEREAQAVAAAILGHEGAVEFAEGEAPEELAQAEDAMRDEGAGLLDAMVTGFVTRCAPLAEKHDWAGLADVRVPLEGKYANWLRGYLMRVVEIGRDALAASEDVAVEALPAEVLSWVRAQADSLAAYHAGILRFAVAQSLMNDTQAGMSAAGALRNAVAVANGAMTRQVGEDLLAASEIAVEKLQE